MIVFIIKETNISRKIPTCLAKFELLKGYSPGIKFPALYCLPVKQTSCIWYKILFIDFLVINMITETVEWKIINDPSKPLPKVMTLENNREMVYFFKKFKLIAYKYNKKIVHFEAFVIEIFLLLQSYILPIITFNKTHLALLEAGIQRLLDECQKQEEEMKYEKIILKQNLHYIKKGLTQFVQKNISIYPADFRDLLINIVNILIDDNRTELQNIQQEIEGLTKKGLTKQLTVRIEKRECIFNSLNDIIKINDTLQYLKKIVKKKPIPSGIHNHNAIGKFKIVCLEIIRIKGTLKDKQNKLDLTFSIKEELYYYFTQLNNLKPLTINIPESHKVHYTTQFVHSELIFKRVPDEMVALIINPSFCLNGKHKKFIGDFLKICKIIIQRNELWTEQTSIPHEVFEQNLEDLENPDDYSSKLQIKEKYKNIKLLKRLKLYFQEHIKDMCTEMMKYIHIPANDHLSNLNFLSQCYEHYLSSQQIFINLKHVLQTIFSDLIIRLQYISRSGSLSNFEPDIYCSDPTHDHSNVSNNSKGYLECSYLEENVVESLQLIRKVTHCLSFTGVLYSLEKCSKIIDKISAEIESKYDTDDSLPIIEFLYAHCDPEVFTGFFITLRMLDIFLPTFTPYHTTEHCWNKFYKKYIFILENSKIVLNE